MNKFILLGIAVGFLAGCSATDTQFDTTRTDQRIFDEYVSSCTFKDGKTPAPKWVCGYPIEEYPVTEIGYSESGSEAEARAQALVKLAGRIETAIKSDAEATTISNSRRETTTFRETSRQTIDERLNNTRVLLRLVDPSTRGLHVLVVAEREAYGASLEEALMREPDQANP